MAVSCPLEGRTSEGMPGSSLSCLCSDDTKYPNRLFQVRHPDRWVVYATDPTLVKEIVDIRDGRLSLLEATREVIHAVQVENSWTAFRFYKLNIPRSTKAIESFQSFSLSSPEKFSALYLNYWKELRKPISVISQILTSKQVFFLLCALNRRAKMLMQDLEIHHLLQHTISWRR